MSRSIALQSKRIGVGHAGLGVLGSKRRHCRSFVEPDKGIELLWQRRVGVVAHQLGVGPVDNTYEPLQPRLHEASPDCLIAAEIEQEKGNIRVMADALVAVAMRRTHAPDF